MKSRIRIDRMASVESERGAEILQTSYMGLDFNEAHRRFSNVRAPTN